MTAIRLLGVAAVATAGLGFGPAPGPGWPALLIAPAQAIVGRPLTPVSVAGVARRTTRRTVVATTAVVAATPKTTTVVVAAPTSADCVKVIESNGATTYRCP